MAINERNLIALKSAAGELRDRAIQAKATMKEVEINIENHKQELLALGIKDIDNVDEELEAMESKVEALYNEAQKKIEKWV